MRRPPNYLLWIGLPSLLVGGAMALIEVHNHTVCDSAVGQFAQALSVNASDQCGAVDTVFYLGLALAAVGVLMAIAGLVIASQPRR